MIIPIAITAALSLMFMRNRHGRVKLRSQSDKWRLVQFFRTPEAATCALQAAGYVEPMDPTVTCQGMVPVAGKVVEWVGFHLRVRAFQSDWFAYAKWSGERFLYVDGVYDKATDDALHRILTGAIELPFPAANFHANAQYLRSFI